MNIKFRKCNTCGNIVWSFNDTNISCCGNDMVLINPNSVDASFEKHVPNYEIENDKININVNHVMEDNHYIMWIMMVNDNEIQYKEFKPGEEAKVTFNYKGNGIIYSYCNLHSLWSKTIE
jgi:superoxide reductase